MFGKCILWQGLIKVDRTYIGTFYNFHNKHYYYHEQCIILFYWCLLWWCHKKKIMTSHYEADGGEDAGWLPERGVCSFQPVTLIVSEGRAGREREVQANDFFMLSFLFYIFKWDPSNGKLIFQFGWKMKLPQIVYLSETLIKN